MKVDAKQKVSDLIEGPLRDEEFELAQVVVSQYKSRATVRVFVYGPNGVSLEQCAHLSRLIGDLIETTDLFAGGYMLEVSSPGLDRPLTQALDYRYRVGETVKIEFVDPKRKKLKAEIVSVDKNRIEFSLNDEVLTIDLAEIKQAKIVY